MSLVLIIAGILLHSTIYSQPLSMTRDEIIQYTPLWKGERFPDGPPKVPDDIKNRKKY